MNVHAVAFTGHRKLHFQYPPSHAWGLVLRTVLRFALDMARRYDQVHFVSGGAIGFDQVAALAVMAARSERKNVTLTMALPFRAW